MNIKINPIEVDISDDKRFTDVCLFVDRDDLLKDIYEIRLVFDLPVQDAFYHWKRKNKYKELTEKSFQKAVDWLSIQPDCEWVTFKDNNKRINPLNFLVQDYYHGKKGKFTAPEVLNYFVWFLCKRYTKNSNFRSVISAAIVTNKVSDIDYQTTILKISYSLRQPSNEYFDPGGEEFFEIPKYAGFALYFLPNTSHKEIMHVLKRDLPAISQAYDDLIPDREKIDTTVLDNISNIRRDREWYWLNKKDRMSAAKIYHSLGENPGITQKGVEKALKTYKDALKKFPQI